MSESRTVFFDIGATLGVPSGFCSDDKLSGLRVYSHAYDMLRKLHRESVVVGVISNTSPNETTENMKRVFEDANVYEYFYAPLLLYSGVVGLTKNSPRIFSYAAELAGHADDPDSCIYVGEDVDEGAAARAAGFQYVPHISLLSEVLDGQELIFVNLVVPGSAVDANWTGALSGLPFVPLHVKNTNRSATVAITSARIASKLDDLGFQVTRLGVAGAPQKSQLYLLRDDRSRRTGFLVESGESSTFGGTRSHWVLESSAEGLLVALPAGESIDRYHFAEARHGHSVKLMPDFGLLHSFGLVDNAGTLTWLAPSWGATEVSLDEQDLEELNKIDAEKVKSYLMRYTKLESTLEEGGLDSRHVAHPDNIVAVNQALNDFAAIGISAKRHLFKHAGTTLANVEAEIPGQGNELVLITAHIDSTAAFDEGEYDPGLDPAPGADDDASGIAAVFAIAEAILSASKNRELKRTIRFVLFNAEEQGLVGSQSYARDMVAFDTPIVAVYQMDMIGFRSRTDDSPQPFEVHFGCSIDADVEERSKVLADYISQLVPLVSPNLSEPQIYRNNDPAEGRSDHASFQRRGYAACVSSEDFFVGPLTNSPEAQPNPNYHQSDDVVVNCDYAADIARAIGAAALRISRT